VTVGIVLCLSVQYELAFIRRHRIVIASESFSFRKLNCLQEAFYSLLLIYACQWIVAELLLPWRYPMSLTIFLSMILSEKQCCNVICMSVSDCLSRSHVGQQSRLSFVILQMKNCN